MSYDERLAARVRQILAERPGALTERKMFGGICFMIDGSMCCGVLGNELIVRVGPERHEEALAQPHARVFDFSGRPSRGMVYVGPKGVRTASSLEKWIARGLSFR